VLQCDAACCSVLRCVLQCVITHGPEILCSVLQCVLQCVAVCCSMCGSALQCDAECCSVMQCVSVLRCVLQCDITYGP